MEDEEISEEKNLDMSNSNEEIEVGNEHFETTIFPFLVIDFLSSNSIHGQGPRFSLNRLTSVTSNPETWFKVPKSLTSCQIELDSESHIESILSTKNTLIWNNVCLKHECYINYSNFPRFASQLGPTIQNLKMDKFFGSIPEISFISCCTSLKSLTIIELDVRRSPRMLLPSEFPNLNKTFCAVKTLIIESIFFDHPKQLEFFKNFLNRFPKLDHTYVPHPHGPNQTKWETLKTLQSKYLIKPIVDYLNGRQNNMMLPVNPIRRTVETSGLFSNVFPELALACVKNGAFLTGVNQKQIQNLFLSQDTTLGKILSINDGLNDRRALTRWTNLEKVELRTSACDIRVESLQKSSVTFPQLKSICLTFDSDSKIDPEFINLKSLLKLLIGTRRLGIKSLEIHWPPFGHDTPPDVIEVTEVIKNFPNLLKFHASNWKAWDDELIKFLTGSKRLQHIVLEDCSFFTEFGFLGSDLEQPVVVQLNDLKYLEIVNRNGSGSITDTCFQKAFRNMALTALVFDTTPNLVTVNGYESLKTGKFNDSIQVFPEPKTWAENMTKEAFVMLRDQFKHFQ